jgi:hypothetical protein
MFSAIVQSSGVGSNWQGGLLCGRDSISMCKDVGDGLTGLGNIGDVVFAEEGG